MNTEAALPPDFKAQPNPPARPSPYDDNIRAVAGRAVAKDVAEWLEEEITDELVEMLTETMPRSAHIDGFQWAVKLQDKYGLDGDSQLVGILDGAGLWPAHSDAVREWVKANGIAPKFLIGQRVLTDPHGPGTITNIFLLTAEYVVQTEDRTWTHGENGYLIPFEKCSEIANG